MTRRAAGGPSGGKNRKLAGGSRLEKKRRRRKKQFVTLRRNRPRCLCGIHPGKERDVFAIVKGFLSFPLCGSALHTGGDSQTGSLPGDIIDRWMLGEMMR